MFIQGLLFFLSSDIKRNSVAKEKHLLILSLFSLCLFIARKP